MLTLLVLFLAILGSSSSTNSIVKNSSPSTQDNSITIQSSPITSESVDNNNASTIAQTFTPTTVAPRKNNEPDSRERYLDEIKNNWMKQKWRREWSRNQMKLIEERRLKEKEKQTSKI